MTNTQIYIDRLRIMFNIALKRKIIRENPFAALEKLRKNKKEPVFLVLDELKQLNAQREGINPEVVNAFFFSCQTGLRFSDIEKLSWKEVEAGKYLCKKSKKDEPLHLSEKAEEILENQRKKSEDHRVFALRGHERVNKELKKWATQAGILKKITFHVGRHTCATMLITSGVDIYTVSKILGHSSVKMTEIYAQVLEDKKIAAVKKLPKF